MQINVREARQQMKALLDRVSKGEEVVILRRGKQAAKLVSISQKRGERLPSLKEFRNKIHSRGKTSLSDIVIRARREERY